LFRRGEQAKIDVFLYPVFYLESFMPASPPELIYFGDSLTDNGNLYDATEGLFPDELRDELAGPSNAVSDGPTHAAYTTELTGLSTANYAIAAAEAAGSYLLGDLIDGAGLTDELIVPITDPALDFDINLGAQIDRFEADSAGQDLSGSTAFILIGGNDYGNIDFASPTVLADALATMSAAISGVQQAAFDLALSGVGTIVISTLPNIGFFPSLGSLSDGEAAAADLFFSLHNGLLNRTADQLNDLGYNAEVMNLDIVTAAITEDPTGFGLIAQYDQTMLDSNVLDDFDADQVAFYDSIHPSTATHGIMGAFTAHYLNGDAIDALNVADNFSIQGTTNDLVFGYEGADTVVGNAGDDIVFGGSGRDEIFSGADNDLASGGKGSDLVKGMRGNDILDGDSGDDTIIGGAGDDLLIDGLGDDNVSGGYGNDSFIFAERSLIGGGSGTDSDVFNGGMGFDTLYLVLDTLSFDTLADALTGATPNAALASLGISATNIEQIEVLDGRADLASLSGEAWFDQADVWGLI